MDLGVKDKVYLLAGASRGLAFGIAEVLAENGAKLAIASSDEHAIHAAAQALRQRTGADILATRCDVTVAEDIVNWRAKAVETFGAIDGLLVNAGGPPPGNFDVFDDAAWQQAFELTLMSAVRMIRTVLPDLRASGGGSILTLTSSSVKEPVWRRVCLSS
jgi:3-oxoacyl-[acyl-carrier protein] reductase